MTRLFSDPVFACSCLCWTILALWYGNIGIRAVYWHWRLKKQYLRMYVIGANLLAVWIDDGDVQISIKSVLK